MVGELYRFITDFGVIEGYIIKEEPNYYLIKLKNGYNIGIKKSQIKEMENLNEKIKVGQFPKRKPKGIGNLGFIYTGGTIGSKVDYLTGGVSAIMDIEELLAIADLPYDIKIIDSPFVKFSEDLNPKDWVEIVKSIERTYKKGAEGIIVAHGTDTMHFSSAYAYYALENPIPIAFTGAQRSSDRASTDAVINLFASSIYANSNIGEVAIVMHETINDDTAIAIRGISARKMHSTRRDAFKSINEEPLARIYYPSGKLEIINKKYRKRSDKEMVAKPYLDTKGALIWVYPGFDPSILEYYRNYRGIIIAGTGMGHTSKELIPMLKELSKDLFIGITTQCIYGITHPYVYSRGRELSKFATYLQGTPEKNYVKLLYVLGKESDLDGIKKR